jgi:hypothetical protein
MHMNPFEHFILTRFNVPLKLEAPAGAEAAPHRGLDVGWLTRRFDLFERVCLPSLQRQTEGAFQWLVFLDWATPVSFKERIAAQTVRHAFLRRCFCSRVRRGIRLGEIRRREEPGKIRITNDAARQRRRLASAPRRARAGNRAPPYAPTRTVRRGFYVIFPSVCERRATLASAEIDNAFQISVAAGVRPHRHGGRQSRADGAEIPRPAVVQVVHDDNGPSRWMASIGRGAAAANSRRASRTVFAAIRCGSAPKWRAARRNIS